MWVLRFERARTDLNELVELQETAPVFVVQAKQHNHECLGEFEPQLSQQCAKLPCRYPAIPGRRVGHDELCLPVLQCLQQRGKLRKRELKAVAGATVLLNEQSTRFWLKPSEAACRQRLLQLPLINGSTLIGVNATK